ncbi:o-succinylbenzoate synthase [Laspinema olomoucense]|uniref:o-succinylbenzoate synthase n=1 Tax=Laspinema olomoucense D3b TaxID=2953688 RepID=A0ABT2N152_9CYAN|nr:MULTISPECIES: o-succinylbenzoate synthase [unclassified Laspinema]MCT7974393.1 o-succinylbenzoate synthase [Laspinema sp. D3d]MCT7976171.1 o-succinylbenzoate synthase [Laspinema sp. D3b]MCT7990283.1 o-succinylbenzoate synthase [Laspinema sp. D3a]MCT7994432.1 o-succinylbenzoate synthase [Laspinema sp. D3c]
MNYKFEFRPYQRKFKRPLQTSHGTWEIREGIILRLTADNGKIGLGEIAPIGWFGSETFLEALDYCRNLPDVISDRTIFSLPPNLPACQFGLESAWESATLKTDFKSAFSEDQTPSSRSNYSGLLPGGEGALLGRQILWMQGYRTFKWKIGVLPFQREVRILQELAIALQQATGDHPVSLRLDANGGLSLAEAEAWLQICDQLGGILEYLEQPLPVTELEAMVGLLDRFSTPIALDESIATLPQMQSVYRQGWRGIYVIKPCIAGSPSELRQFCHLNKIDAVFSSVFETEVGRKVALKLAGEIQHSSQRALGFGVDHLLESEKFLEDLW